MVAKDKAKIKCMEHKNFNLDVLYSGHLGPLPAVLNVKSIILLGVMVDVVLIQRATGTKVSSHALSLSLRLTRFHMIYPERMVLNSANCDDAMGRSLNHSPRGFSK